MAAASAGVAAAASVALVAFEAFVALDALTTLHTLEALEELEALAAPAAVALVPLVPLVAFVALHWQVGDSTEQVDAALAAAALVRHVAVGGGRLALALAITSAAYSASSAVVHGKRVVLVVPSGIVGGSTKS